METVIIPDEMNHSFLPDDFSFPSHPSSEVDSAIYKALEKRFRHNFNECLREERIRQEERLASIKAVNKAVMEAISSLNEGILFKQDEDFENKIWNDQDFDFTNMYSISSIGYPEPIQTADKRGTVCGIYPANFQNRFASSSGIDWAYNIIPACRTGVPVTASDTPSSLQFNPHETSNRADVRIEILEDDDYIGIPEKSGVCFPATYIFGSSSHRYKFACYDRNPFQAKAQDIPSASHFHSDDQTKFQIKLNNIILAITGQAAISLVSSSSSDSPFLHFFAAAAGIGFFGNFFANYVLKKPKIARILSKIGAIGAASAVIFALGLYLPKDTKWNLNMVATFAACLISGVVVATA